MRPLWRWTIGDVAEEGWEVLSESIFHAKKVYPDFDFIICHNNSQNKMVYLESLEVDLFCQDGLSYPFYVDCNGPNYAWKLMPPRLSFYAHELWVDNDIVIRGRLPEIDEWLESDTGIISSTWGEAFNEYGRYVNEIPSSCNHCAGFFGLPPQFDMEAKIQQYCDSPLVKYDEQGLVILIMNEFTDIIKVRPSHMELAGYWDNSFLAGFMPPAIHFMGINRDYCDNWRKYKKCVQL